MPSQKNNLSLLLLIIKKMKFHLLLMLKLGFSVVGNSRVAQTIKLVRLGDFLNLKSTLEDALTYLKN